MPRHAGKPSKTTMLQNVAKSCEVLRRAEIMSAPWFRGKTGEEKRLGNKSVVLS
jgi:hypothetical protein